jgi:hypothetical protein
MRVRSFKGKINLSILAAISCAVTVFSPVTYAFIPNQDRFIDLKSIIVVKPVDDSIFNKQNVTTYVPTNLTPTRDSNALASQLESSIGQKITEQILNSDIFKKSSIGQIQDKIQTATNRSVSIQSGPNGITHKFNLTVQAAQRVAKLNYEGFFKSDLVYDNANSFVQLAIYKPLNDTSTLTLTNTMPSGSSTAATSSVLSFSHTF